MDSLDDLAPTVADSCHKCATLRFKRINFYDGWLRSFQPVRTGLGRGDCHWLGVKSATRRYGAGSSRSPVSVSSPLPRPSRP